MSDWYMLDENHNPVKTDMMVAAARMEEDRTVAKTTGGEPLVSTVFLGLDHQWGYGPPLVFETMLFDGPEDGYQERYATWAEAEAGHERAVAIVSEPSGAENEGATEQ